MGRIAGTHWSQSAHASGTLVHHGRERVLGIPDDWFHLLLGLLLAPILAAMPFLELVGWFFEALVHEMGHTAASWFVGVPAVPSLAITAEAATMHGEQSLPLTLLVWSVLVFLSFRLRKETLRYTALALLATAYPVLCFSGLREIWHLASGHLGELAVGGIFLWRALSGGFSPNAVERGLYSILAWFLLGRNMLLGASLAGSAAGRAQYEGSGSYGLTNDFVRLVQETGVPLEWIGTGVAMLSLTVVPIVVGVHHAAWRRAQWPTVPRRYRARAIVVG